MASLTWQYDESRSGQPLRGVEIYSHLGTKCSDKSSVVERVPLNHDNNYRGFEIYNDDDDALELDEIDMQNLAATAHPKMKSRCMHLDHVMIGLPTYTQVVKGDMERMLSFIEKEARTSVITEFVKRNDESVHKSYATLMEVHKRYRQITAALQREFDD